MEYLLLFLKVAGLLLAAIVGLWNEKDTGHSPTKSSPRSKRQKHARSIVIISLGIAISAEIIDTTSKRWEAAERQKLTNELLVGIHRQLSPLFPLKFDVSVAAELKDAKFTPLLERLEKKSDGRNKDVPELKTDSTLFPSSDKESDAYGALRYPPMVTIFFYRTPLKTSSLASFDGHDADMILSVQPSDKNVESVEKFISEEYRQVSIAKKMLYIQFPGYTIERIGIDENWSAGNIISSLDLLGSQMVISVSHGDLNYSLSDFSMTLTGSREIHLNLKDIPVVHGKRSVCYFFTFPKTEDLMAKFYSP